MRHSLPLALLLLGVAACGGPTAQVGNLESGSAELSTPVAAAGPEADPAAAESEPEGHAHDPEGEPAAAHEHHGHGGEHGAEPGAEGATAESSTHHGHQHNFDDPELWASRWDTPERDEWQRPAAVVAAMGVPFMGTVVDLGTGTGYFVPHLSDAVGPSGRVVALDVEPAMVEWVRQRADREGLSNVEAREVPLDDPGLEAATYDRVLCVNTWHHIEGREAYAARIAAALTDRGAFYVVEYTREAEPGPPAEMRLDPDQVIADLEAGGLSAELVAIDLPRQYVIVGRR